MVGEPVTAAIRVAMELVKAFRVVATLVARLATVPVPRFDRASASSSALVTAEVTGLGMAADMEVGATIITGS